MPPDVLEILIVEMPFRFSTPKKRSSSVSPELPAVAIATGPIVPREAPSASNASNVVVPSPQSEAPTKPGSGSVIASREACWRPIVPVSVERCIPI